MEVHIVFDLDGTLTDTQRIHQQVESDFLKSKWLIIDPQTIWMKYAWRTPQERITELLSYENFDFTDEEVKNLVFKKDETVLSLLHAWKISLMPHVWEILIYLHDKWYKLWISSWCARPLLDQIIAYFHLDKLVTANTSADEVKHKKPHPDVFLSSFSKLEKVYGTPDVKYVIGDGRSDTQGWHKSWATTIWLNPGKKEKLNDSYCDFEIASLKEIQTIL